MGELPAVGPCIAGIVDIREQDELGHGLVIEEGVIPGAISVVLAKLFGIAAGMVGNDTDDGLADFYRERTARAPVAPRRALRRRVAEHDHLPRDDA